MNNDLEQLSEERLMKLSEKKAALSLGEVKALARIALSIKQAKPVGYATRDENYDWHIDFCGEAHCLSQGDSLFTNPQPAHTEQDGWIKCSERMPECSKLDHAAVIASEGSNSFVAYYNKHECKFLDEPFGESLGNKITHWMPLPKPPVAAPKPESE